MRSIAFIFLSFLPILTFGQGAYDGYMKGKGHTDIALTYSYEHYDTYYFGKEPQDISVTTQTASFFLTSGLQSRLDVVMSIPYIRTDSLNSSFQDAILGLKYRNLQTSTEHGSFSLMTVVGVSFPLSSYPIDTDRPIGERAGVFQTRLMGQYQHHSGFFFMAQAGLDFRIFPIPQTAVPIVLRTGFAGRTFYMDVWLDIFNTLNAGQDQRIAGGQGPVWTKVGGTFYKPLTSYLGVFTGGAYILSGRNIGQAWRVNVGIVGKL